MDQGSQVVITYTMSGVRIRWRFIPIRGQARANSLSIGERVGVHFMSSIFTARCRIID
jgi:hypothetical protein